MIEILKMVKKCKIYQNKGSQAVFANLPGGCPEGMVTLGTD